MDIGTFVAKPFRAVLGSKPVGIWLVWLGVASAAVAQKARFFSLAADPIGAFRPYSDAVINGPVIVAAIVLLALKKPQAQIFCGIACANLLVHTIFHGDLLGTCLGILGFLGLLANAAYFQGRHPR